MPIIRNDLTKRIRNHNIPCLYTHPASNLPAHNNTEISQIIELILQGIGSDCIIRLTSNVVRARTNIGHLNHTSDDGD